MNEDALGVDHPRTITCRACVADVCQKQGFFDKASPLLEEVVSARERVLGRDHPHVATALNNRALLLRAQVCTERCMWMLLGTSTTCSLSAPSELFKASTSLCFKVLAENESPSADFRSTLCAT